MKSLDDLYQKKVADAAPSASATAATSVKEAPSSSTTEAPVLETPPGLPQKYVDINLKNQPLPAVIDMATAMAEQEKPMAIRLIPTGETLINATDIPFIPGRESKIVKDRIQQGPHVFVSRAQKEKFEQDLHEEKSKETPARSKGPTVAHPDTLKPGTFITGESFVYRPV